MPTRAGDDGDVIRSFPRLVSRAQPLPAIRPSSVYAGSTISVSSARRATLRSARDGRAQLVEAGTDQASVRTLRIGRGAHSGENSGAGVQPGEFVSDFAVLDLSEARGA